MMRSWPLRIFLLAAIFLFIIIVVILYVVPRPQPPQLLKYREDGVPRLIDLTTGNDILLENEAPLDPRERLHDSPDGRYVARWRVIHEWYWWKLQVEDTVTNTTLTVGEFSACDNIMNWSPDSRTLAVSIVIQPSEQPTIEDMARCELHLYDAAANVLTRISDNTHIEVDPAFSPDGTHLVFVSGEDGYNRLYIMDLATRERTLLTANSFGYRPAWSPDGRWIAFMSNHESWNDNIYIIAPDGTGLRQITSSDGFEDYPEWVQ
jgi:Tol biopolymer transport system component